MGRLTVSQRTGMDKAAELSIEEIHVEHRHAHPDAHKYVHKAYQHMSLKLCMAALVRFLILVAANICACADPLKTPKDLRPSFFE